MVERQLEMVEGFDESLRHSGKNYALPKVWTVPVSDDLVFTLASDCFFFSVLMIVLLLVLCLVMFLQLLSSKTTFSLAG